MVKKSENRDILAVVLPVLTLVGFMTLVLGFVFSRGLCCADDANLALRAKNLANGYLEDMIFLFDPHLAVVLPAALMTRLMGNHYWVPGLTVVIVNSGLLIILGLLLPRAKTRWGLTAAAGSFLLLNYVLMSRHFEHWFGLFGEVPAALLILLAVVHALRADHWALYSLVGLIFSLAFLTKILSLLTFGVFFLVLIAFYLLERLGLRRREKPLRLGQLGAVILGFLSPFVVFELIRILILGVEGIVRVYEHDIPFILERTVEEYQAMNPGAEFQERLRLFREQFGVPYLSIYLVAAAAGVLTRRNPGLFDLWIVILAVFVVHSAWWFFFSVGWTRHMIIPLTLLLFLAVLPLLEARSRASWAVSVLMLAVWAGAAAPRVIHPIQAVEGGYFRPTERTRDLMTAAEALSQRKKDIPVVSQWVATGSDLAYLAEGHVEMRYTLYGGLKPYQPPFWLAVNKRWLNHHDQGFQRLLQGCSGLEVYGSYLVGRCE